MSADAILLSKYKKNRPENAFREVVSTREVYGEKWRIFRAQNFSGALRNTRKSFREVCGTVSGPEKFSGLLRNARLVVKSVSEIIYNKKCSRRFERNHGPSSGEVKKILYQSTLLHLVIIGTKGAFSRPGRLIAPKTHSTKATGRCSPRNIYTWLLLTRKNETHFGILINV